MKKVLMPTDFDLINLKAIDTLLENHRAEKFHIVLFHAFRLSDSISDLLMLNRRSKDYEYISDEFYAKLEECKLRYAGRLERIDIQYHYGSTAAAFHNFTDYLELDYIAVADDFEFRPINKYSLDPLLMIERSKCKVKVLQTEVSTGTENLFETKIPSAEPHELVINH